MRKYLFLFFILVGAALLYLSFPLNSKNGFVTIRDKKFQLNGKDFYPVAVNYLGGLFMDGAGKLWPGPATSYDVDSSLHPFTQEAYLKSLRADFELIKEMGFNTVRVVGIGEESMDNDTSRNTPLSVYPRLPNGKDTSVYLLSDDAYSRYFNALEMLFKEVNDAGLKVVFLIRVRPGVFTSESHLKKLLQRFKNDTAILAYDLFNEPLYFDHKSRLKTEVDSIVKGWNKLIKMYAPNQLSTIGLEGIREIFEWDPNILDVDFVSFHPYDFEPDQVMNEIYWYGKYVNKPWIIGETALAADNDSVTYLEQKHFARKTLAQVRNCGGVGYTWWQYKDVEWSNYRYDFMGVVTRDGGKTVTNKNGLVVQGIRKPVIQEFLSFNSTSALKDSCECLPNYYNYSNGRASRIIGRIVDAETNEPIEGAVALAWDEHWVHSFHTITKKDGSFELLGEYPFYHWIATATMHSVVRDDMSQDVFKKTKDSIPTFDLGTLKINKLKI